MKAAEVLEAIQLYHHDAAIVHELVLDDPNWRATYTAGGERGVCRRIDALMVTGRQRTAIEIKVSRADFFRETPRKRHAWQVITHRFVYVTPAGLVRVEEVPDGAGLWEVDPETRRVRVVKRARINREPADPPTQLFVALCYRAMRNQRTTNPHTEETR